MSIKTLTAFIATIIFSSLGTANEIDASFGHYSPKPAFEETISSSFYVTMRDGVKLAMKIERPAKNGKAVTGKFPIIWHHTMSVSRSHRDGTGGFVSAFHQMPTLAKHGYVVAQVARRGNGQSFGIRRGYHDRTEAYDAYEVNEWLAKQSWSDGNVGLYGCSNTGDAALHAMTVQPPALKAVFASCFSWHKFDAFRRGGIFAQWGTGPTRSIESDMQVEAIDGDENKVLLREAVEERQVSTPLLEMWKSLPFRNSWSPLVGSRFWWEGSGASYMDQIQRSNIPLYVMGGWHDELRDQGMITFLNVPNSRVVIGPWKHCKSNEFPMLEEIHRYFDYHLKGIQTGIEQQPKIHYYTMDNPSEGEWKSSNQWPLANKKETVLYVSKTDLKSTASNANNTKTNSLSFITKKEDTCPLEGPNSQPCAEHAAGISYTGEKLEQAMVVTGHPVMNLWMSSTTDDANIFAYLEDVAPNGNVTVVTEGRLKASLRKEHTAPWKMPQGVPWHRANIEDSQPLEANQRVNLRFDLLPTSWVFKKGHKIQVSVTSSDYRERLRDFSAKQQITLYSGKQYPTHITLPIEPKS